MTYEEARALIAEHLDYGGSLDSHALAVAISASDAALESRVLAERKEPSAKDQARRFVSDFTREMGFAMSDHAQEVMLNLFLRHVAHPTPDDARQWISVKDRLPDEGQAVMFVVASKYPDYNGRVFGGSFCMLGGRPSFNTPGVGYFASHWMPTPKPPAAIDRARQSGEEGND